MNLCNLFCQTKKFDKAALIFEILILISPHKYLIPLYRSYIYKFPYLTKYVKDKLQFDFPLNDFVSSDSVNILRTILQKQSKSNSKLFELMISKKMNSKEAFIDAQSNL